MVPLEIRRRYRTYLLRQTASAPQHPHPAQQATERKLCQKVYVLRIPTDPGISIGIGIGTGAVGTPVVAFVPGRRAVGSVSVSRDCI